MFDYSAKKIIDEHLRTGLDVDVDGYGAIFVRCKLKLEEHRFLDTNMTDGRNKERIKPEYADLKVTFANDLRGLPEKWVTHALKMIAYRVIKIVHMRGVKRKSNSPKLRPTGCQDREGRQNREGCQR